MTDPLLGTTFARFRIESLLGQGGMGVVYRAIDERLDRTVALKVLAADRASDPAFRERFLREARLLASLRHGHIVTVFEADEWQGQLYLAMEYIAGPELRSVIEREGPLEPARAVALLGQVADALDAAHAAGLVHRDIKPGNILVLPDRDPAGPGHAYLTDFGLTKPAGAATSGLTMVGQFVGTPGYVAPEQIEGKGTVDHRADIYALGCVLYNALTGDIPYPRDSTMAVLWAHVWEPPPRVSEISPELAPFDEVLATALAKSPAERFQTAGAFAAATKRAVSALGRASDGATPPPGPSPAVYERTATDLVRPISRPTGAPAPQAQARAHLAERLPPAAGVAPASASPGSTPAQGRSGRRAAQWQRQPLIAAGIIAAGLAAGALAMIVASGIGSGASAPPDGGSHAAAGSLTPSASTSPTTPPSPIGGTVAITAVADGDPDMTQTLRVNLKVSKDPTGPATTKMLVSNDNVRPAEEFARPFLRSIRWDLAPGDAGVRTVFIWFGTEEGGWSTSPRRASITFDQPPVATTGVFDRTDACRSIKSKGYVLLRLLPRLATDPDTGDTLTVVRAWKGKLDFKIIDGTTVKIHITPRSDFNFASFTDRYTVEDRFGLRDTSTFELRVGRCP